MVMGPKPSRAARADVAPQGRRGWWLVRRGGRRWLLLGALLAAVAASGLLIHWSNTGGGYHDVEVVLAKLRQLRQEKSAAVSSYFELRQAFVGELAGSELIGRSLGAVGKAWHDGGPDGADYHAAEADFDQTLRRYAAEIGCYDLFLIDAEGQVVYTIMREADFGADVTASPYRDLPFGRCFAGTQ